MIGYFNEEAQALWDFARCIKPDGSVYGTAGTCRLGTRQDKEDEPAKAPKKHDAGRLTQKKIDSLSDEQLKSLVKNPKLYDYQRKRLQQELDKRGGNQSKSSEKPKETKKEPKGLFMAGKDVDIFEVEKKAEKWRKEAGLNASPGTIDWKHDRVHALTHEFLGGSNKIGEWIGQGPKSPTAAEETLVNMVHRAAALKARGDDHKLSDDDLERYFTRDIQFMSGRGNIADKDLGLYFANDKQGVSMPDAKKFIAKYREMESTPGFEKLLDASHSAFTNAGDYLL
jgi:hypothetical protein